MYDRQFQFEWDEGKAIANMRKHGITFDLARTVFIHNFLVLLISNTAMSRSVGSRLAVPATARCFPSFISGLAMPKRQNSAHFGAECHG